MLVYDYEEKYEQIPSLQDIELLQALLEEDNLQPKDLVSIFEHESIVLEILQGNRQITEEESKKLRNLISNLKYS